VHLFGSPFSPRKLMANLDLFLPVSIEAKFGYGSSWYVMLKAMRGFEAHLT